MAFGFYRTITLDHTQAGTADTSDWPMLFSFTNADFKTVANGGLVQNASGFDICFSSDLGGSSLLSWEMQSYDAVNGVVLAWVKVPTLSHTADTVIYVQYADATISTFQGGLLGAAWNANYWQVYHLGEASNPFKDSTAAALDSNAGTYPTQGTGNGTLGKAQAFVSASSQFISGPNSTAGTSPSAPETWSGWCKLPVSSADYCVPIDTRVTTSEAGGIIFIDPTNSSRPGFYVNNFTGSAVIYGSASLNDGNWHFICGVIDGGGAGALYVDGVSVATVGGGSTASTNTGSWIIGAFTGGSSLPPGGFGGGSIQEVRILKQQMSTSQITADFNSQKPSQNMTTLGAQNTHGATPYIPPPFSMVPYAVQ